MRGLVWFRSDLRVRDNTALAEAARRCDDGVVGVFAICPAQWASHDWGPPKIDFILRSLGALSAALAERNIPLKILRHASFAGLAQKLMRLAQRTGCGGLFYNAEYEANEIARDAHVADAFEDAGLPTQTFEDQTIIPPAALRTGAGAFYSVFTPFRKRWEATLIERGTPKPRAAPRAQQPLGIAPDPVPTRLTGFVARPTLADRWPSGEDEARRRLRNFASKKIDNYDSCRDFAQQEATSTLSPYLAAGVVSARQCLAAATKHQGTGAAAWTQQLVWREFYRHVMVGFPRVGRGRAYKRSTERVAWRNDPEAFERWCTGTTGVPIVDAGMRQLNQTGWMHNRLRMVTAMYLTKDLLIDWRQGERYFARHLVDVDLANNNGGWQWAASTGTDAVPYFRVFNPYRQATRFDPDGLLIARYCPELAGLTTRALHDPRLLPAAERRKRRYAEPIIDHGRAKARAIAAFKRVKS